MNKKDKEKIVLYMDGYEYENVTPLKIMTMVTGFLKVLEKREILDKNCLGMISEMLLSNDDEELQMLLDRIVGKEN